MVELQEIHDELTRRAGFHPQARGRRSQLCPSHHNDMHNVPCPFARANAWLYDLLDHPLAQCSHCHGYGWVYGEDRKEFEQIDCPHCSSTGIRGTERLLVHTHGPDEGDGLACNERVIAGRRIGACQSDPSTHNNRTGDPE